MDYSPLNAAFYNINEVREDIYQEQEQDQNQYQNQQNENKYVIDDEKYININDGSRFGQTGNSENLITGYTHGINSKTMEQSFNRKENFGGNGSGKYFYDNRSNLKEDFNGNHHYWNGQIVRNGIDSNVHERFTTPSEGFCNGTAKSCNCKHNTFLLYLCILLLVILYFKK